MTIKNIMLQMVDAVEDKKAINVVTLNLETVQFPRVLQVPPMSSQTFSAVTVPVK